MKETKVNRYIAISLLIVVSSLAIISRKYYSKYKDGRDPMWPAAAFIYHITPSGIIAWTKTLIRKDRILNTTSLEDETTKQMISVYRKILWGIVLVSSVVLGLTFVPENKNELYKLKRPETGEASVYVDMQLRERGNKSGESFRLEVSPRQYSEKEFNKESEKAKVYIDKCILQDNPSKEMVTTDVYLPTRDEKGILSVTWSTSDPDIISSTGQVNSSKLKEPAEVTLTADIRDENHSVTYPVRLKVVESSKLTSSEKAKASILNIEEGNRSEKELVLPHTIGDISIIRESGWDRKISGILVGGIIVVFLLGYIQLSKLKEKGKKRDSELRDSYFSFVNKLAIYIGAGLGMKDAIAKSAGGIRSEILKDETVFMLNKISSGVSEGTAYMDFGRALGLQEYIRLMSLISQNLVYGNSNLIKMLDSEAKQSINLKREHIRKKGEEASEKLLLPTSMLLILVIIIIMYPAFIGM